MNHSVPNARANSSAGIASIAPGVAGLAGMARQRPSLVVDEVGHVDGVVDLDLGCAERVAVVGGSVGVPLRTAIAGRERTHVVAAERRLEHSWRTGKRGGAVADPVRLDVVGMSVAAVPVVGDKDVGVLRLAAACRAWRRRRRHRPARTSPGSCSGPTRSSPSRCSRATGRGGRRGPRRSTPSLGAGGRRSSRPRQDRPGPRRARRSSPRRAPRGAPLSTPAPSTHQ